MRGPSRSEDMLGCSSGLHFIFLQIKKRKEKKRKRYTVTASAEREDELVKFGTETFLHGELNAEANV